MANQEEKDAVVACATCGKQAFYACEGCLNTAYCSSECQTADWKVHKNACRVDDAISMEFGDSVFDFDKPSYHQGKKAILQDRNANYRIEKVAWVSTYRRDARGGLRNDVAYLLVYKQEDIKDTVDRLRDALFSKEPDPNERRLIQEKMDELKNAFVVSFGKDKSLLPKCERVYRDEEGNIVGKCERIGVGYTVNVLCPLCRVKEREMYYRYKNKRNYTREYCLHRRPKPLTCSMYDLEEYIYRTEYDDLFAMEWNEQKAKYVPRGEGGHHGQLLRLESNIVTDRKCCNPDEQLQFISKSKDRMRKRMTNDIEVINMFEIRLDRETRENRAHTSEFERLLSERQDEIRQTKANLEKCEDHSKQLQDDLYLSTETTAVLKNKVNTLKDRIGTISSRLSNSETIREATEKKLEQYVEYSKKLKEDLEQSNEMSNIIRDKVVTLERTIQEMNVTLSESETRKKETEKELNEYIEKSKRLKFDLDESTKASAILKEKIVTLEKHIEFAEITELKMKQENKKINLELIAARTAADAKSKSISIYKKGLDDKKKEAEQLKQTLDEERKKIEEYTRANEEYRTRTETLLKDKTVLEEKVRTHEEHAVRLRGELHAAVTTVQDERLREINSLNEHLKSIDRYLDKHKGQWKTAVRIILDQITKRIGNMNESAKLMEYLEKSGAGAKERFDVLGKRVRFVLDRFEKNVYDTPSTSSSQ